MSRKKRNHQAGPAASGAWGRARQAAAKVKPAAAQVKPAAARVKPAARSAGAAAGRGMRKTRAWAAPQVERTGQVLRDSVAPKVSALLSSAARRLEPASPRRRNWRKLTGISMLTAAAGAAAAVRNRMKPDLGTGPTAADSDDVAPAAEKRDGQAGNSNDAGVDGQVRTS